MNTSGPLGDTPPESLLEGPLPPIKEREEIRTTHPVCEVKCGDLIVMYVGELAMEYYGFLNNRQYSTIRTEQCIEWYEEYHGTEGFDDNTKAIYRDVAPVLSRE